MRTIRECICDSTEAYKDEVFEDGVLPICLGWFIRGMANILVVDAYQRLKMDCADVSMEGTTWSGKAKDEVDVADISSVLTSADLLRGAGQGMQLQDFLRWFLEQEEPNTDDLTMWYDLDFVVDKWNEFAAQKRSEKE